MPRDFEDLHDIDDLSDDELRDLVREHLAGDTALDPDDISVEVEDGVVRLSGRVGTEAERQIADHIVTDTLGIDHVENELLVDALRRADSPEAADEHDADEEDRRGRLLGDRAVPLADSAEHRVEDLDAELFGTHDLQAAMEQGTTYEVPDAPTPEGLGGNDAPGGERH